MRQESTPDSYITLFVRIIVALGFVYVIWSLSKNMVELTKLDERLINAQEEVDILVQKNKNLQQELEKVGSSSHEEGLIRNELGLVQPGETLVIIPQDSLSSSSAELEDTPVSEIIHKYPIWQQWFRLFL